MFNVNPALYKIVAASEAEEDTTKTQTVAEETVENIEETTENNQ